jgi:acetoin utilization deacetylase AcuC-like enzyme
MVAYMATAHASWLEAGYPEEVGQDQVTAYAFPHPDLLRGAPLRRPRSRAATAGVWAMDTMTPIGRGTFEAARGAIDAALTAADLVATGERAAYAACRPPGHHAGRRFFGGSCYLNNAAAAAEALVIAGHAVAIVDLDAHHGNGTQEIFYDRGDVFYGSIHVDPGEGWFPHWVGFADETGVADGEGANLNVPLAPGDGDSQWLRGLGEVIDAVEGFQPHALVVSLGVDAGVTDENSPLLVTDAGYGEAGAMIADLNLPTVFVQEGGYDLTTLAGLVLAALDGFERRSRT